MEVKNTIPDSFRSIPFEKIRIIVLVFLVLSTGYPIVRYLMETNFGSSYNTPFFLAIETTLLLLWCVISYYLIQYFKNIGLDSLIKPLSTLLIGLVVLYIYNLTGIGLQILSSSFVSNKYIYYFILFGINLIFTVGIFVVSLNIAIRLKNLENDYIGGLNSLGKAWIFISIIWLLDCNKHTVYYIAYDYDLVFEITLKGLKLLIALNLVSALVFSLMLHKVFDKGGKYIDKATDETDFN